MGQKINPVGLRVGINRTWDSRWYADKNYADLLHKDVAMRAYLQDKLQAAGISRVVIERPVEFFFPSGRPRPCNHSYRPSGCCDRSQGSGYRKVAS